MPDESPQVTTENPTIDDTEPTSEPDGPPDTRVYLYRDVETGSCWIACCRADATELRHLLDDCGGDVTWQVRIMDVPYGQHWCAVCGGRIEDPSDPPNFVWTFAAWEFMSLVATADRMAGGVGIASDRALDWASSMWHWSPAYVTGLQLWERWEQLQR